MDPQFETILRDEGSSFRSIRFSCANFSDDHNWHYHPELELTWIMRSEGTRFVGDSIHHFRPGDLVLIGPDLPHCWHNDHIAKDDSDHPELAVLQFKLDCFGRDFLDLPEAQSICRLIDRSRTGLYVPGNTAKQVQRVMQALLLESGMDRLTSLLKILSVLADSKELKTLASPDYHIDNDINETNRRRIHSWFEEIPIENQPNRNSKLDGPLSPLVPPNVADSR